MPRSPVDVAWARFAKTGAPADYLAYRQARAQALLPRDPLPPAPGGERP